MTSRDRTLQARAARGRGIAFALAVFVNLLFVGFLVFSVSWQNRRPEPVMAELYAPPPPAPPPQPRIEPAPQPKPPPPPVKPVEERPDQRAAEIALKAKQEAERRKREEAEKEQQRKEAEQRAEEKRAEEKRAEEKRAAEQKARVDAMRAQAEREVQQRARAEREAEFKAQAERELQASAAAEQKRARDAAERAKADRARGEWIDRIRAKIKSNLVLPADLPGNPEAVFEVVQIPSGDIIDVHLRKSSGVRAYDDAVQRAILKSSPLPGPSRPDDFQRVLTLRFRPLD